MPQARSGGSRRSGSSRSSSSGGARRSSSGTTRSTAKRSTAKRSTAKRTTAKRSTAKRSTAKRSSATTRSRPKAGTAEARFEAAANRVRKLNEQIIENGRSAGESTLTAYEKFLKSIATSIERGPGKSDVEWISNLATAQAKFIRDVTSSVTKAARKRLK
jgi:hypothetical protein